ncbi:MAG: archaetidylserine decarboxylase [Bacteroidales bacterium]|jgi:phosphatidylserine decarboxylase|nr:archaetidylserine decarboxylase [Bacteroidales bacterium]
MTSDKQQKQNYRNLASRIAGHLSNIKYPRWFVRRFIRLFKNRYNISLDDYQIPENGFETFNSFFTRRLKDGARPLGNGIISPVDGYILDYGHVNPQNKIYVKHQYYYVDDLILENIDNLKSYSILYLAPSNYHRVHACFDMAITKTIYLPGTLRSVSQKVVDRKDRVYCRNERIVIHGNSDYGKFRFVLIGAMLVGKAKLSFDSDMETNMKKGEYSSTEYKTPVFLKKGEELGYFEMGSSVIILLEEEYLQNIPLGKGEAIKVGESLVN